ncbi:MAG: FKBP-type peptidyl-prolyl cis-trans isomerase [Flavobacteriales bacterium]|nr:FKBP-type peptidyl-prolyl cis-trans isomerase [Flavobacteriales bacterium]
MRSLLSCLAAILLFACDGDGRVPVRNQHPQPTGSDLLQENRDAVKLEQHDIDLYAKRTGLDLQATGTGVRYLMLRDSVGRAAEPDQWAKVNYTVHLLNGDSAYASVPGKPESFMVEMDQVESGLHEAIQLMSAGDSAVIVIPSYRAHGLIGDQQRIPMRSTIVYHLGVVAIKNKP